MNCQFANIDMGGGIGSQINPVSVPVWKGRLPRQVTAHVIADTGDDGEVLVTQLGSNILIVSTDTLSFDKHGGCTALTVETNAESIDALITNMALTPVVGYIKSVNVDGQYHDVNDKEYAETPPGDPGASRTYIVQFAICMPANAEETARDETLIINGKPILIHQDAFVPDALDVSCPPDAVGASGTALIDVSSNTDWVVEVTSCTERELLFELDRDTVTLNQAGDAETVNLLADPDIDWEVEAL